MPIGRTVIKEFSVLSDEVSSNRELEVYVDADGDVAIRMLESEVDYSILYISPQTALEAADLLKQLAESEE